MPLLEGVVATGALTVRNRENIDPTKPIEFHVEVKELSDLSLHGAGDAVVHVSEQLDAGISGAGSIQYLGTPKVIQSVTGAGQIRPKN
ncbi:MAG: DUF2807 domain-containing protein [Gemmataceae bacterium]|nr:DUF2807 domain-containing protein [Gemmataceae bacterium]